MISTKLYEGIALDIPLLATIPAGEVEDIINEFSRSSYVITEKSSIKVAEAIKDAMAKYEENQIQSNYVDKFLESFSRERLTLKLMNIIDQSVLRR